MSDNGFPKFNPMRDWTVWDNVTATGLLIAAVFPVFFIWKKIRTIGTRLVIPIAAMFTGAYGFLTNHDMKDTDICVALAGAILLASELGKRHDVRGPQDVKLMSPGWRDYLVILSVLFCTAGLLRGASRARIEAAGPLQFYEHGSAGTQRLLDHGQLFSWTSLRGYFCNHLQG